MALSSTRQRSARTRPVSTSRSGSRPQCAPDALPRPSASALTARAAAAASTRPAALTPKRSYASAPVTKPPGVARGPLSSFDPNDQRVIATYARVPPALVEPLTEAKVGSDARIEKLMTTCNYWSKVLRGSEAVSAPRSDKPAANGYARPQA